MIALQRLRIDQVLPFHRHDSTVVKITAISDTSFVTQEIVVPPRAAKIAKLYPLPRHYWDEGLMRYGFHGLSYAYILQELARQVS
ncbi:MAG TPA: hypothetical protein VNE63_16795 [Candidatus Acidoferrales bacterium]|nr:hypothetical protein [Candidatus Acidoferrales bacterium]